MNYVNPEHFSNNYKIDLNHSPVKMTDRVSGFSLIPAFIFSIMLIGIGMYDLLNGYKTQVSVFDVLKKGQEYQSLLSPVFFDVSMILLGFSIICSFILSYIRYKKIRYENGAFEIVHRPSLGSKIRLVEKLADYEGVLFRVESAKHGAFVRHKYIIEMLHSEPSKTIPLYISSKFEQKMFFAMLEEFSKFFGKDIKILKDDKIVPFSLSNASDVLGGILLES